MDLVGNGKASGPSYLTRLLSTIGCGDTKNMNNHLAALQHGIGRMSTDMANVSYQLTNLTGQVGGMEYNVDRMVRPLRMVPFP